MDTTELKDQLVKVYRERGEEWKLLETDWYADYLAQKAKREPGDQLIKLMNEVQK